MDISTKDSWTEIYVFFHKNLNITGSYSECLLKLEPHDLKQAFLTTGLNVKYVCHSSLFSHCIFFISFLFPFFFLCFFIQIPFDFFIGSLHCLWGQLVKVLDIHWKMTNTLVPAIFKFWNTWVSSLNRDLLFPLKFGSPVFFSCPSGHPQAALPPISQA